MTRIVDCPPVVAITQGFDGAVARRLMQMRVADLLVKPVPAAELVRACARVAKAPANTATTEAQIFTFLPAVGGAGVTTLAVQTAMLLLNSGARGKTATCLVDLDFQHGACADYLDLEPRLNLGEIEPRPERLDRQLLEVMLSHHPSGLAVIAAPNRPAEMRLFDPDVVTRLLDLVSSHFDFVVFDMPRTWFSWTDSVLLGSNRLFIVSETTVPGCATPSSWSRRSASGSATGRSRRSSSIASCRKCSPPACADRYRAGDRRRICWPACPTITRWCARPSTAVFRSTRSSPATRSRSSSKKSFFRKAAARPAKEAAAGAQEIQALLGAIVASPNRREAKHAVGISYGGRFSTRPVTAPGVGPGGGR